MHRNAIYEPLGVGVGAHRVGEGGCEGRPGGGVAVRRARESGRYVSLH